MRLKAKFKSHLEFPSVGHKSWKGIIVKVSELSEYFMPAYLEILNNRTSGELWPPQAEAVEKGLLDFKWKSFVVSAPHGSGKTLVAELATVRKLHEKPTAQILYLVPYKAMALEIHEKFAFLHEYPFGRETGIWTGDQAIDSEPLLRSNFMVLTYELFQLMLKSDLDRILNADLIIVDELHFIEERTRGPRQEAAITRLLTLPNHPPILALCSVVSNFEQIREWLGCGDYFVSTRWKLNPLFEGVVNPDRLTVEFYQDGNKAREEPLPVERIEDKVSLLVNCCLEYLQRKGETTGPQILIFVPTRSEARKVAQLISHELRAYIASGDINLPEENIEHLLKLLDETVYSSSITLGNLKVLFSTGVAYHHAGLGRSLRTLIETQFREKRIIVLVSTTTLGVGVNLPASRVYFLEVKAGKESISPIMYRNMAGRAGRPQFRENGESVILSMYPLEMQASLEDYIRNPQPELESYLLRDSSETESATLTWISQGLGTLSELTNIVSRSFAPPKVDTETSSRLAQSIEALRRYGFIVTDESGPETRYVCTSLGHAAATSGAEPEDIRFLVANLTPKSLVTDDGGFDRLEALFFVSLTSRFDNVFMGRDSENTAIYNSYLTEMDLSARANPLSARGRVNNAFFIALLLEKWVSGKSLSEIGKSMRTDFSAEELVERLVPNAAEMLHHYLMVCEKCGPESVHSNENLTAHLRSLRDSLEVGADTASLELVRLFRRRPDGRDIVQRLNALGIATPKDLLDYPYEDFSEESAEMKRSDFFYAKTQSLLLIENTHERQVEYVRLLARHRSVHDDILEKLLSKPEEFEEGVRKVVDQMARMWPGHLESRQARDFGAGSELPRPESYLVVLDEEEQSRFCFEAKVQLSGAPIGSHDRALSPLVKCRGDSTHRLTIGWPSFQRELHAIARDRGVSLIDSATFALVYVWMQAGFFTIGELLTRFGRTGIVQPDAFDVKAPRWWPHSPT